MNEAKSPLKSKTIWVNLLTLLAVSLTAVADHTIITENPVAVGALSVAVSIVNVALRMVTKSPLK